MSSPHHNPMPLSPARLLRAPAAQRARLLPSGDGWSLVGDGGQLLVRGHGFASRRDCLEYARVRGILTLDR